MFLKTLNSKFCSNVLLTLTILLVILNFGFYYNNIAIRKEQDLISNHLQALPITIMKTIYEEMEPYFRLDKINKKKFLNDPYEIISKEIDLFYVPK